MTTKVAQKIKIDTKAFIVQAIKDIISDPDFGLELTDKAKKRLQKASVARGKTISLADIKKKYHL